MGYKEVPTGLSQKGKVYVVCNGCPENRIDVARAEKYLVNNGWSACSTWQEADLILFNACGREKKTTSNSLEIIREIQNKKREKQQLVVWGCLPKIDPEVLKKEYKGMMISGGSELPELIEKLNTSGAINQTIANNLGKKIPLNKNNAEEFDRYKGSVISQICKDAAGRWNDFLDSHYNLIHDEDPTIFYISILTGCRSNCSYCAIHKSRGTTKSKPKELIVKEFQEGLDKGFTNFNLMGTDVGSYGIDYGSNLMNLLKDLIDIKGSFSISLRNVNPTHLNKMINEFIPILKSNKIRYIEMPVESGSNRILQLMNRGYTIEEYKSLITRIREACPKIIIRTQVIAGFPTETDQEFKETIQLLEDVVFDFVEVYEFSARPGTPAEKIEPKVPDQLKSKRYIKLYKKALLNRTGRKIKRVIFEKL
jgi:tRNA A37 methylthiotransferase MiaB